MRRKLCAALACAAMICVACSQPTAGLRETRETLGIHGRLVTVPDPRHLRPESLPAEGLVLATTHGDIPHLDLFRTLVIDLNENGDTLLDEVFVPLVGDRQIAVPIVATRGLPVPYDAWTARYESSVAFFFCLDQWTDVNLRRTGPAVIRHELTHVILEDLLPKPDSDDPVTQLESIVINEGIAHFVGHPDRHGLLTTRRQHWAPAEQALATARAQLSAPETPPDIKEELLRQAHTGAYWQKYAAIAGMFRAADLYRREGAAGLRTVIEDGLLPASPEMP